jgi:hypothetical protein
MLNTFLVWSAKPVQSNKILPVFRFYASLPRAALLQGKRFNRGYVAKPAFHF